MKNNSENPSQRIPYIGLHTQFHSGIPFQLFFLDYFESWIRSGGGGSILKLLTGLTAKPTIPHPLGPPGTILKGRTCAK